MQKHFSKAMEKVEGLINLWSVPSAVIPSEAPVLLAVSGGIDSMCMADLFLEKYGPEAVALAHCNFHLRGEESDGDEALVRGWADRHGVRCHVKVFETETYAASNGISIEMAARELRYKWFAELCRMHGYRAVAVAHNANDNAETLILNLLRGTGLRGLGGMSLVAELPVPDEAGNCSGSFPPKLIRPLLECSRKMIEGYAFVRKIAYREDSTNASSDYKRNRIRNEVFPIFERINPSFIRTLNREIGYFSEAGQIVDDYCTKEVSVIPGLSPVIPGLTGNLSIPTALSPVIPALSPVIPGLSPVIPGLSPVIPGLTGNLSIPTAPLLSHPHWRYLLYYILEPYGFNHSVLASVEDLLLSDRTISGKRFESDTHMLMTGRGVLTVVPRTKLAGQDESKPGMPCLSHGEDFMPVHGPGTYHVSGRVFKVEELPWTEDMPLRLPEGVLQFDAARLRFPFAFRRWRQGDWLVPFGMKGRKKVSDLFADLKYDILEKSFAVMLADTHDPAAAEGRVAAVMGVRMDERYKITDATCRVIRITENRS